MAGARVQAHAGPMARFGFARRIVFRAYPVICRRSVSPTGNRTSFPYFLVIQAAGVTSTALTVTVLLTMLLHPAAAAFAILHFWAVRKRTDGMDRSFDQRLRRAGCKLLPPQSAAGRAASFLLGSADTSLCSFRCAFAKHATTAGARPVCRKAAADAPAAVLDFGLPVFLRRQRPEASIGADKPISVRFRIRASSLLCCLLWACIHSSGKRRNDIIFYIRPVFTSTPIRQDTLPPILTDWSDPTHEAQKLLRKYRTALHLSACTASAADGERIARRKRGGGKRHRSLPFLPHMICQAHTARRRSPAWALHRC